MMAAFLGLHFDGSVDATGIATVLLAVATAGLAVYTRASVKQGAVELAQSQRPVLVPLRGVRSKPELKDGRFLVPVVNVGVGPAMTIRAEVEFGDINGEASAAPQVSAATARTAIGANEQAYLAFENVPLTSAMGFALNIEFADVTGTTWHSRGFYSEAECEFRDVNIREGQLSEPERYRVSPRVGHT
ncbi:MAG: hypothetical protein M3336_16680 [Chloroflexota bacterium]|nr:hypothetical protein [Chloroflexota bacterium]